YSTSWEKTGDWNNVLTKSYVVYLPEGMTVWSPAARAAARQLPRLGQARPSSTASVPEADILNCTTVDAHNCLFFRIG
ncbi:MAG: hypothetical protein ACLUNO_08210, partial [Oscillospiraceae bacterium]